MPINKQNTTIPEVKTANRLAMANRDLLEADDYLRALKRIESVSLGAEIEYAIRNALITSAVVAYCKSFSANNGAGIASSQININSFSSIDKKFHAELMDLRNKAVAHSDADTIPAQIIDHDQSDMLVIAHEPFILSNRVSTQALEKQIDELLKQIQIKLHAHSEKLRSIPDALGQKVKLTLKEHEKNSASEI